MIMVDWVTCVLPFKATGLINGGHLISVDLNGEIEYEVQKRMEVIGTYESKVFIKTVERDLSGNTSRIEVSGNLVKFMQGHNLFGSSDLINIVSNFYERICLILKYDQEYETLLKVKAGFYTISRIDINCMYLLDSRKDVLAYLNRASLTARTRSQSALTKGSTVYFNNNSRRWSLKMYSKGQELELKRNRKALEAIPRGLIELVDRSLRVELTLRSNELRQHELFVAFNWRNLDMHEVFNNYAGKITMAKQKKISSAEMLNRIKSRSVVATYQLWLDGNDVRFLLPKRTFYRHRKVLLEHDIDISIACPINESEGCAEIIPFTKGIISVESFNVPEWVLNSAHYWKPKKYATNRVISEALGKISRL